MTARWVVDEVRPHRDLEITWQPISLFVKNEADPDDERGARYFRTHRLLRVLESVRAAGGDIEALGLQLQTQVAVHKKELAALAARLPVH